MSSEANCRPQVIVVKAACSADSLIKEHSYVALFAPANTPLVADNRVGKGSYRVHAKSDSLHCMVDWLSKTVRRLVDTACVVVKRVYHCKADNHRLL